MNAEIVLKVPEDFRYLLEQTARVSRMSVEEYVLRGLICFMDCDLQGEPQLTEGMMLDPWASNYKGLLTAAAGLEAL